MFLHLRSFKKTLVTRFLSLWKNTMPGYKTRLLDVTVGQLNLRLKALKDNNQYFDPDKLSENAGVAPANWSFFGQLWPAAQVLANAVKKIDIAEKRIIELGCGLGLPSLVLKHRNADITASDRHPLSRFFLESNSLLNHIAPIPFVNLSWEKPDLNVGKFDVIIASDVLYERDHATLLAELIHKIAEPIAKVMVTCPGRGHRNKLSKLLMEQGFTVDQERLGFNSEELPPFKGRLLTYKR